MKNYKATLCCDTCVETIAETHDLTPEEASANLGDEMWVEDTKEARAVKTTGEQTFVGGDQGTGRKVEVWHLTEAHRLNHKNARKYFNMGKDEAFPQALASQFRDVPTGEYGKTEPSIYVPTE